MHTLLRLRRSLSARPRRARPWQARPFRHRLRPSRRRHCSKKRMLPDGQRLQQRLPSMRTSAFTALSGRTRMRPGKNRSWSRPPSGLLPVKHSWMWSRRGWMARMPSSGRTTWRRGARHPHRSPQNRRKPLLQPALRANCPACPSRWALMCRRAPSRCAMWAKFSRPTS